MMLSIFGLSIIRLLRLLGDFYFNANVNKKWTNLICPLLMLNYEPMPRLFIVVHCYTPMQYV